MKRASILLLLLMAPPALAGGWQFGDKVAVAPVEGATIFQHLDSTGRKSLAVSGDRVAVVWEDNRSGSPHAYIAFKSADQKNFSEPHRLSSGQTAYAPTVVALRDGRFLAGWEEEGAVWVRLVAPQGLGPAVRLGNAGSTQIALATRDGNGITTAWCEPKGAYNQIVAQELKFNADKIERSGKPQPVDRKPVRADQSYPAVAVTPHGSVIAWEDRRHQHTILLYSHAPRGGEFSAPRELNEVVKKSERYGRGSGVTRVALDAYGDNNVIATWMDKRGNLTGYDIYAAFSRDGGRSFGANELVQDSFAENFAQWHPAVTTDNGGRIVVAWDDDRDDVSNIWLAWKTPDGWSENVTPPPATSGEGDKTHPVVMLDAQGVLHVLWLEHTPPGNQPRVMYAAGRAASSVVQNP